MSRKLELIERFSQSEEQVLDVRTGLDESAFQVEHPGKPFEGRVCLPNGEPMSSCDNCAD